MTAPDKAPELKPCPFCGESDYLQREHMAGTVRKPAYRVACDNCGASSRYTDHGDEYEVWNERRADVADAMVAVKPLRWETSWRYGLDLWRAEGYEISHSTAQGWHIKGGGLTAHAPMNLDHAKATAQADYEKRILSALQSPSDARAALSEAERKAWNAAIEAAIAKYDAEWRENTATKRAAIAALKKEPEA